MKNFAYEKTNRYFAQIARGLEPLGVKELKDLGAKDVQAAYRGIYFNADKATLYRVNYLSRLCSRILAPLLKFDCHSTKYLHKTAMKLDWGRLMGLDHSFAINATVTGSKIRHSHYAALCLKDAIADSFRQQSGSRPSVDPKNADINFHLRIDRNKALISLDTSGGSLHRRGYRQQSIEAPMQETVAAAIITLSGWDGDSPLYDPMCGSGTILCEAMMHYCRIPAGYLRKKFGFMTMPNFEPETWDSVKKEANKQIRRLPKNLINGSDMDQEAVAASRSNCALLPHGQSIKINQKKYRQLKNLSNQTIICNPPYGIRLEKDADMDEFIKNFGNFLKQKVSGSEAFIYFGKPELAGDIGLQLQWEKPLMNGGLHGVLTHYLL